MDEKSLLRTKAKNIRKTLQIAEISRILTQALEQDTDYINSNNVMLYYPLRYEIDLRGLFNDNKNFYLPRVKGEELEVCPYNIKDELVVSNFGVFEPVTQSVEPSVLDFVIVPALMADSFGFRLGYGGGFYDRFLKLYGQNFKTVSLLPRALMIKKLPTEGHDIKIDKIIFK